jgi:two-component system sensor histidine kinase/response regulator
VSQLLQKTILVVDDTPENLRLLTQLLGEQGYRVRSAPSGARALATMQKEPPDLVLLDILMPEMDGYETCRRLKADTQISDIPVIFISALNEVFDKVTAFSSGGVDYITKPFQVAEVLARIQTHLTLKAMRETLCVQNQMLMEQNQELEAFAHTVAHDLKNPLFTLLGFLELMKDDVDSAGEKAMQRLHMSASAAQKMNNIVEELLLLASIRKEEVYTEPIDMAEVVNRVLERLAFMLDKHQPELILPDSWPQAQGYAAWIEEVWVNYLSNGLKYGGKPPCLELGATALANGTISFWVRDNGPGIDTESQAMLFTEFTRLDRVRAKGHGLGLSIVRRIMDKLGGDCGVQSTVGEGSLFYFILPQE